MGGYASQWKLQPMLEEHGLQICGWRYPQPYEVYNWTAWDAMVRDGEEFADPDIRRTQYAVTLDRSGAVSGFAQFFPMAGVTRLGFGLRPDLCGRGNGADFVRAIVQEAARRAPGSEIDLEVLVWNERAIRCYEAAGFTVQDTYERPAPTGMITVHCMVHGH